MLARAKDGLASFFADVAPGAIAERSKRLSVSLERVSSHFGAWAAGRTSVIPELCEEFVEKVPLFLRGAQDGPQCRHQCGAVCNANGSGGLKRSNRLLRPGGNAVCAQKAAEEDNGRCESFRHIQHFTYSIGFPFFRS